MPSPEAAGLVEVPQRPMFFIDNSNPTTIAQIYEQSDGRIVGVTTNPSTAVQTDIARALLARREKLTRPQAFGFYRDLALEINHQTGQVAKKLGLPGLWSMSLETDANPESMPEDLAFQGGEIAKWVDNAWIKLPTTAAGIEAARQLTSAGIRVNMTLIFSQAQAAAVDAATRGAKEPVFASPFVGRLDDEGQNGMDLIWAINKMWRERYQDERGHVWTLTASVRKVGEDGLDHLFAAYQLQSDIITLPPNVFEAWARKGFPLTPEGFVYDLRGKKPIPYEEIALGQPVEVYNIQHHKTDEGLVKFAKDWNTLIA